MKNEPIDMLENAPKLKATRCIIIAYIIEYALKLSPLLISLLIWYIFDYFYAIAIFLISYLVLGIVRSKLLHVAIPKKQQEHEYSDKEIAIWYVSKRLCYEDFRKMDINGTN